MLIIPAHVPSYYSGKSHKYNYDNGAQIVERIIAYFLDEHDLTSGMECQFTSAVHHSVPVWMFSAGALMGETIQTRHPLCAASESIRQ